MKIALPRAPVRTCHALCGNRVVLPLLLVALAFALRVYRLQYQSLWFDEAWTANVVAQDAISILQTTAEDVHPPLYFLVLHLWTTGVGNSEFALRFFSLIPSVVFVPFTCFVGRKLLGRRAGLVAATIVAVAPLQVYYAQEARSYALLPVLTLASTYLLLRACTQPHPRRRGLALSKCMLGYVAVSVLSLHTHYTAFYILVAQQFFLVHWWWRRRRDPRPVLVSQLLIFLCCLPWLIYLWAHPHWKEVSFVLDQDPISFRFLWLWRNLMAVSLGPTAIPPLAQNVLGLPHVIQVVILAVLMLGAVQACRAMTPARSDGGWLLVWTFVIALVLVTFLTVPGDPRHVMVSTPSHYLLLALGIARIAGGVLSGQRRFRQGAKISTAVLALTVAASAFFLNNQYHKTVYGKADDFRSIFPTIEWLARPNDVMILTYDPLQLVLAYYWRGHIPDTYFVPSEDEWAVAQFRPAYTERRLRDMLDSHARYWLIEDLGMPLEGGAVERWLSENTFRVAQESYGRTRISLFSIPGEGLDAKELEVNFNNNLLFHDPEFDRGVVESGDTLHYKFRWGFLQEVQSDFTISLRLSDGSDSTYATQESLLSQYACAVAEWSVGTEVEQRVGVLVPPGTPPGAYHLKLVVYDTETSLPLFILDQSSMPVGTELVLDEVQIIPAGFHPSGELAPLDHSVHQDITDSLRILGHTGAPKTAVLGDTIRLDVYWQASEKPTVDFLAAVALQDMQGSVVYQHADEPANGTYPFSVWTKGEIVIDKRSVLLPADTLPGQHQLVVVLIDPNTQQQIAQVPVGSVLVVDRPRQFKIPSMERSVNATFGGKATLIGYELTPAVARPGESLHLTLYWQAVSPTDTSYTVFAHLIDHGQQIWGQIDSVPGKGTVPTTGWVPGEVIVDPCEIPVGVGTPEGAYRIEVGLYNAANGQRLAVTDGEGNALGDSVLLDIVVDIISP